MLKRGGREGPNVTNPTLTHDRPTKLFAFLQATTTLKQMLEYRFHDGGTAHNCSLSPDSLKSFISVSFGSGKYLTFDCQV
jgi:hypothetical protein